MTTLTPPRGGLAAVLAFLFAFGVARAEAQDKSLALVMPSCPISAKTAPNTKTPFPIPSANPLGAALDVTGTVQVTDQTSSTIFLTQVAFDLTSTGMDFARTIKQIGHATGQFTFDKGCTKTDPYGSNNCHWDYTQNVIMATQGALQEDVTAGKLIVDLKLDGTIPFQFTCPICGNTCAITVPEQFDQSELWTLFFSLYPFSSFLIGVPTPPSAPTITTSFTPSTIATLGTSALAFTVTNPNSTIALTGVGFTDSLPIGITVTTPSGLAGSCGGGTIAATASGSAVSLTGGTLAAGASCTFSVDVTSSAVGNYVNTTGAVAATESFTGLTASASLATTPASQAIAFTSAPPASPMVSGTYTVSATGGASGSPVTFAIDASSTSGACTISGNIVSFQAVGTCIVDANQAGNANFTAAPQVAQTILVGKKTTTITLTATPNPVNAGAPVNLTATVAGDPPTGTVSFAHNGVTLPCSPVALVAGATSSTASCTAAFASQGTHSITATYSGDASFAQATSAILAVTIGTAAIPAPMFSRWAMLLLCGLLGAAMFVRVLRK